MSIWLNKYPDQQSYQKIMSLNPESCKSQGHCVWDSGTQRIVAVFKNAVDAKEFVKYHDACTTGVESSIKEDLYVDSIVKGLNQDLRVVEQELNDLLISDTANAGAIQLASENLGAILKDLKIQYQMLLSGDFKSFESIISFGSMIGRMESIQKILTQKAVEPAVSGEIRQLMEMSDSDWEARSPNILNEKMRVYIENLIPEGNPAKMAGLLEKHGLNSEEEVAVVGDIHGNALRLELTLKLLQQKRILDQNYHCLPGKRIVFLGDYVDRGTNSLKVLEILITLKMENQNHVYLIRGNHEDLQTSAGKLDRYAALDPKYKNYMSHESNLKILSGFYDHLPVAVFLGEQSGEQRKEYVQFCHGLFHLYTDPAPLLESQDANASLWVDGAPRFTERVQQLINLEEEAGEDKLRAAAKKLVELQSKMQAKFDDIYWLDAGEKFEADVFTGRVEIPPEMVKAYLQISGTPNAHIKEIMRGHQLGTWTIKGKKQEVLVTTIDPTNDPDCQIFMIIKTAPKVKNWKKTWVTLPMFKEHTLALKEAKELGSL